MRTLKVNVKPAGVRVDVEVATDATAIQVIAAVREKVQGLPMALAIGWKATEGASRTWSLATPISENTTTTAYVIATPGGVPQQISRAARREKRIKDKVENKGNEVKEAVNARAGELGGKLEAIKAQLTANPPPTPPGQARLQEAINLLPPKSTTSYSGQADPSSETQKLSSKLSSWRPRDGRDKRKKVKSKAETQVNTHRTNQVSNAASN